MYWLAYISLLNWVGGVAVQGVEGMLYVGFITHEEGVAISIANIEVVAHLIPLEPE